MTDWAEVHMGESGGNVSSLTTRREGVVRPCLQVSTQVPPAVRRLSSKRLRYRKRLALMRQVGDEMLGRAKMEEVPSVES